MTHYWGSIWKERAKLQNANLVTYTFLDLYIFMGAEEWGDVCRVIGISLKWQPPLTLQFQREVPQSLPLGEELEVLSACQERENRFPPGSQIGCPIPSGYSWTHGPISKAKWMQLIVFVLGECAWASMCPRVHIRQRKWGTTIKRSWIW